MRPNTRILRRTLLAVAVMAAVAPAVADDAPHTLNIAPQSVNDALKVLAAETHLQIFSDGEALKGKTTAGLNGVYTAREALQKLLVGTGLSYRFTAENAVAVKAAENGSDATTTMPAVKVVGRYRFDPNSPDNPGYARTNSTTASKTDTPIMQTPMSIKVVPKTVLDDQQAVLFDDAVTRNVSGVQRNFEFGDLYQGFIVRGFSLGANIYRDGLRQHAGYFEPAGMERIEVLKGAAAMLYGRTQPGGLVNYVTKKPRDEAHYSLQQQFGSFDMYRTTVDATGPVNDDKSLLYRLNVAYLSQNSFRDYNENERIYVAPSLTWRISDRTEATIQLEHQHDDYVMDFGIPALGNRPAPLPKGFYVGDEQLRLSSMDSNQIATNLSHRFNDHWKIEHKFNWHQWDHQFNSIFPAGSLNGDNRTINRALTTGPTDRETLATSLDLAGEFETYGLRHKLLIGGDYFHLKTNTYDNHWTYGAIPALDVFEPNNHLIDMNAVNAIPYDFWWKEKDEWYGVYAQDQITLWDKVHFLIGGRYDILSYGTGCCAATSQISDHEDNRLNPRFGIVYQPWQWLSVYGNYVESIGSNNGLTPTNANNKPELGEQYEAGLKTEFFDGRFTSNLAYYHLTKENMLTGVPGLPYRIPIGAARSQGVELDLTGEITDYLSMVGTYAYADARVTKDNGFAPWGLASKQGKRLPNVPEHSGSLWLTYHPDEHLKVGAGMFAQGKRAGDNDNTYDLPGFVRLDAMVSYSWNLSRSKLTTQFNVNNLLDKEYYRGSRASDRTGALPGEPISFIGSVRVDY
ncbi:TonB-dependent receptor [Methylomonas sp. DH-1]|uniref:TonB-dependent siderophore receptor n=1 Tax=Methylomonas sp. (strain DH-1) TaxID=1727196 RepID=UPI0009ED267A|nr:TonB-dependent receptor [Methylomonas sp. DH-1]